MLFLLKAQKNNHPSASDWWENTKSAFKENARTFSENSTTEENIRIPRRQQKRCKRENFKLEIKPRIENLQDELYQLKNSQAKGAKLGVNIR